MVKEIAGIGHSKKYIINDRKLRLTYFTTYKYFKRMTNLLENLLASKVELVLLFSSAINLSASMIYFSDFLLLRLKKIFFRFS